MTGKRFAKSCLLVTLCSSLLAVPLAGCASERGQAPILATIPLGEVRWVGSIPVLHLSGGPYEMGYQHGTLLRGQVRASVSNVRAFIDQHPRVPLVGRFLARWTLDRAWRQMAPFVPSQYLEEMRGLSDGAGIPLKTLQRIHALPELMATTCASSAAFGKATANGQLIHIRNLDWSIQSGVQKYAALFVYHPAKGHSFVSIGWLGFLGVISGINDQGISIGEIGAQSVDVGLKGMPMPFLLRRVLEESARVGEAISIVQVVPRTGGYNYLFADAIRKKAAVVETTKNHSAVFRADEEPANSDAVSVANAIVRSDFALDPTIRDLQKASNGDPSRPGLESPVGSSAYDVRYRKQSALLLEFYGRIDPEIAMVIARAIAPSSNIQSVVYAYPQMWVANAFGRQPAVMGKYLQFDVPELFERAEGNS